MESAETERWELLKGTLLEGIQPDEGLFISTAAWFFLKQTEKNALVAPPSVDIGVTTASCSVKRYRLTPTVMEVRR